MPHFYLIFAWPTLFWRLTLYHFQYKNLSTKKTLFPGIKHVLWQARKFKDEVNFCSAQYFSFWESLFLLSINYPIYSSWNCDTILLKLFIQISPFFKKSFLREREGERSHVHVQGQGGTVRIPSRRHTQHGAWAKSKSWMPNQLNHPGAPRCTTLDH